MAETGDQRPRPPSWIHKEFIETSINIGKYHKNARVQNLVVEYPNEEGQGYSSIIYRIIATIVEGDSSSPDELQLILKCAHEKGRLKELGEASGWFQRESLIMCALLPEVHCLLQTVEGASSRPLVARCLGSGERPVAFLLMEDLSAAGLRLARPARLLDRSHCRLVLGAYARLHAASAAAIKRSPEYRAQLEAISDGTALQLNLLKDILTRVFKTIASTLRATPGYEKYASKYENGPDRFINGIYSFWKSEAALPVLLHGDSWKNNFMFGYEGDAVKDVRIIDFQVSRIHSPAADLQYFLYANASADVLQNHLDSLLEEYHVALQSTLRALGLVAEADAFPLETLRAELDRASGICVVYSAMTGMMLTSEEYSNDFAQFFENTDAGCDVLETAYRNPYAVAKMKCLLPMYDKKGYF